MQIFFCNTKVHKSYFFFQEYTRGPCPEGKLMVLDRDSGYGKCSCDDSLVKKRPQYGWKITYFWNIPIFFSYSECIIMNLLVNVTSFTNKVLAQKATFCHLTTVAYHLNVNAKTTIIYILMANAINLTPKVSICLCISNLKIFWFYTHEEAVAVIV